MMWLPWRSKPAKPPVSGARAWMAARPSRLTSDLPFGPHGAPNRDVRQALRVLRSHSRHLAQNAGYVAGFLKLLSRNVVGHQGFTLQMRVLDGRGGQDANANAVLEQAFWEWGQVGSCTTDGRWSFDELCRQVIVGVARDGEALLRIVRGAEFNRFGIALQMLDPSQLDEDLNSSSGNAAGFRLDAGNILRMGVEINAWGRPVAYHLRTTVPNDDVYVAGGALIQRVPAEEILHLFKADFPGQVRGVPWIAAGLTDLSMLKGYQDAELAASRIGASKMGFYQFSQNVSERELDAKLAADGKLVQDAEPGTFELLPPGIEVKPFDPQHPNTAFKDFVGAVLASVSAAVGMSKPAFANDPTGLNYNSLRATELEDRDEFRTLQSWMINTFCMRFFPSWLREGLIGGAFGLPPAKFAKFNAATFIGRGWEWVDPQNEMAAATAAVALGIKSRRQIAAEQGRDFDEVVDDLQVEGPIMKNIPPPVTAGPNQPPAKPAASPEEQQNAA